MNNLATLSEEKLSIYYDFIKNFYIFIYKAVPFSLNYETALVISPIKVEKYE